MYDTCTSAPYTVRYFILTPFEPLSRVDSPTGVRIGVQEMTRFGMREPEMEVIASLMKECLIDGAYVGDRVREWRLDYQEIHFSFDSAQDGHEVESATAHSRGE